MTMTPSRILIIDDEKAIRDSFGAYLEDCGYDTFTAEDGRIGLSAFEREHPDLVIVDLRMPEVDGIQVLEQISRISPLTRVIFGTFPATFSPSTINTRSRAGKPRKTNATAG